MAYYEPVSGPVQTVGEWTPERVFLLRWLLGDGRRALSRPRFAALFGGSERSVVRWEQGEARPAGTAAHALTQVALNNLSADKLERLVEGVTVPEKT